MFIPFHSFTKPNLAFSRNTTAFVGIFLRFIESVFERILFISYTVIYNKILAMTIFKGKMIVPIWVIIRSVISSLGIHR